MKISPLIVPLRRDYHVSRSFPRSHMMKLWDSVSTITSIGLSNCHPITDVIFLPFQNTVTSPVCDNNCLILIHIETDRKMESVFWLAFSVTSSNGNSILCPFDIGRKSCDRRENILGSFDYEETYDVKRDQLTGLIQKLLINMSTKDRYILLSCRESNP